jgi:hypothetical protein
MGRVVVAIGLSLLIGLPVNAQTVGDEEAWRTFAARLEPNAFIKVRLRSGESFRGHVVTTDAAELRVNPKTRVAVPLRRLPYSEIVSIERQTEPRWNPAAKVLLGVGISWAVLYVAAIAALASGYD